MENFILTIAFLLIGMGLRRLPRFPRETAQVLNLFVIHVSLPALILLKVPQLTFSRDILAPVMMPWAMLAVSAGIILLAARLRQLAPGNNRRPPAPGPPGQHLVSRHPHGAGLFR